MAAKMPKVSLLLGLVLTIPLTLLGDARTQLKPGWNLFSPEQDVEMGQEVAKQAEAQLQIVNDGQATAYVNALGRSLAAHAPGEKYPYQFKIVNDKAINAFALPGGFIYVNRGTIEAADDEAQLAGVLAHEIGHVALRHGTNQASKAFLTQAPLSILGGMLGSNSVGSVLAQLGIGFAANSILLKYSRDAERQADLIGAQVLHDAGYDPKAMVQFFEKIQAESRGRASEFFSDHPDPGNRISAVQSEIVKLGPSRSNLRTDSGQFHEVKSRVAGMPAPRTNRSASTDRRSPSSYPAAELPSTATTMFNGRNLQFRYPQNWRQYGQADAMTFAPDGGIIEGSLAYGLMVATFEPQTDRNGQITVEAATDQLLDDLRRSNPGARVTRGRDRIIVGGSRGLSTEITNQSPTGERETDWIVTVLRPDGLLYYFIAVAPANEFRQYNNAFESVIASVRFR